MEYVNFFTKGFVHYIGESYKEEYLIVANKYNETASAEEINECLHKMYLAIVAEKGDANPTYKFSDTDYYNT